MAAFAWALLALILASALSFATGRRPMRQFGKTCLRYDEQMLLLVAVKRLLPVPPRKKIFNFFLLIRVIKKIRN
jgi:hypothetical protein